MVRSLLTRLTLTLSVFTLATSFAWGLQKDPPNSSEDMKAFTTLREDIQKLLKDKDTDGAIDKLEKAIEANPNQVLFPSLRTMIAIQLSASNPPKALEQLTKCFEFFLGQLDKPNAAGGLPGILNLANRVGAQAGKPDLANQWTQQTLEALNAKIQPGQASPLLTIRADIIAVQARNLMSQDQNQARDLINQDTENAESLIANLPQDENAIRYLMVAYRNQLQISEDPIASFAKIEGFASKILANEPGNREILSGYLMAANVAVSMIARRDPNAASDILDRSTKALEAGKEANPEVNAMAPSMEQMFKRHLSTIAGAKKLLELVGQPAPAMDAMRWVNGEPLDTNALKGKVVLLDFWAVWCGPCIMTFPHLIEWQETYGPKGLQVVGVTRQYGYAWNADDKKAEKASGEVTLEEELAMLNQFMASHDLKHPSMVTPEDSSMNRDYGVTGIPHAVLIDKAGYVRLIRVGSGDQNAKEIHDMIEKLLAE